MPDGPRRRNQIAAINLDRSVPQKQLMKTRPTLPTLRLVAALAACLGSGPAAKADEAAPSPLTLWYRQPAAKSVEALTLDGCTAIESLDGLVGVLVTTRADEWRGRCHIAGPRIFTNAPTGKAKGTRENRQSS